MEDLVLGILEYVHLNLHRLIAKLFPVALGIPLLARTSTPLTRALAKVTEVALGREETATLSTIPTLQLARPDTRAALGILRIAMFLISRIRARAKAGIPDVLGPERLVQISATLMRELAPQVTRAVLGRR